MHGNYFDIARSMRPGLAGQSEVQRTLHGRDVGFLL